MDTTPKIKLSDYRDFPPEKHQRLNLPEYIESLLAQDCSKNLGARDNFLVCISVIVSNKTASKERKITAVTLVVKKALAEKTSDNFLSRDILNNKFLVQSLGPDNMNVVREMIKEARPHLCAQKPSPKVRSLRTGTKVAAICARSTDKPKKH